MHCCRDSSVVAIQVSAMNIKNWPCQCSFPEFFAGVLHCRRCGCGIRLDPDQLTQVSARGNQRVVHVAAIPLEQEQRCIRCQSVLTTDKHLAFPSPAGKFVTTVMEDGIPRIRTERNYDADVSAGEERCAPLEEEWSTFEELLRKCLMRLGTVDIEFLLIMVRPGK